MSDTVENKSDMSRRAAREQAFSLVFEKEFHPDCTVGEMILNATDSEDVTVDEFALGEVEGVFGNIDYIDALISKNLRGWTIQRISRVTLAILRLAVYEMKLSDSVPESVAINEAVELAKKFGNDDDPAYINGVLGTISRLDTDRS